MDQSKKKQVSSNTDNKAIFEPDEKRRDEETQFYKSHTNFYKNAENSPVNLNENDKANLNNSTEEKFSTDYIKNQIEESNRMNRYFNNDAEIAEDKKNLESPHNPDKELKFGELSNYFKNENKYNMDNSEDNNINYNEDISVGSLGSDGDEKF